MPTNHPYAILLGNYTHTFTPGVEAGGKFDYKLLWYVMIQIYLPFLASLVRIFTYFSVAFNAE